MAVSHVEENSNFYSETAQSRLAQIEISTVQSP
jgi:hypothetical protein